MTEMQRILALTRPTLSPAVLPDLGVALRPAQVDALLEWTRAFRSTTAFGPPGLAVLAGVGHGKTLVGLLLPAVYERARGVWPRTTYLVPAALRDQQLRDWTEWGQYGAAVPPTLGNGCARILSHEALSAPSGRDTLRDLAPEVLVIDEAHAFADPESGRWRRVREYLAYRPETRVVVMSGSLSWRSLRQARHLLLAALRGWCPLPCDRTLDHWAAVVDVGSDPAADDLRAMAPLRDAYPPKGLRLNGGASEIVRDTRTAYRARLSTCPGVVLTTAAGVDASLRMVAWRPSAPMPPVVERAVAGLEGAWVLPDGTEIVSSLEYARAAGTIPLGFYQRYDPDTVDPEYLARRSDWAREVRNLVAYQGHRYQTPSAVVAAAERGDLTGRAGDAYLAWAEVEDEEGPRSETVWLDGARGYLVALVKEYAEHVTHPLLWVRTPALGHALAAILGRTYHGAGSSPPKGGPAVASYRVHGTGWNGAPAAGYREALVLEPPASGAIWEQLVGRLHRAGQVEDVVVHTLCNSGRGFAAIASGIADAEYVQQTTGAAQRLLLADWVGYRAPRGPRGAP